MIWPAMRLGKGFKLSVLLAVAVPGLLALTAITTLAKMGAQIDITDEWITASAPSGLRPGAVSAPARLAAGRARAPWPPDPESRR